MVEMVATLIRELCNTLGKVRCIMKCRFWTLTALVMFFFPGCTHEVKVQPVKVEPVHFTLMDQNKKPVTLSKLSGKWVVLYFYPKDDTPGCTIEAKDFTGLLSRFHEMNAEVLGISEDSVQSHCDFIAKYGIELTLLSDPDHKVMERYGAWVTSSLGDFRYGRTIRTTMIVDPAGVIRNYSPEVIAQGHAERVLKKLAELQGRSAPQ